MTTTKPANPEAPLSEQDDALSKRLVDARLKAVPLAEFPGSLPTTLERAYAVQAASIARWPDDVAGWKVARLPVGDRERFPAKRLFGPVFGSSIRTVDSGSETVATIYDGGFAAIEAEFVLEVAAAIPPAARNRSDEELAGLVSKVYCGAEIASSPMPFVIELGATSIISDLGINCGVIVGPEVADSTGADASTVSVSVDGEVVGESQPGPISGDPLKAFRYLLDHCAGAGIELPENALVSTGLLTGVHDVRVGSLARVDFGSHGWFTVRFEAIEPV